MVSEQDVIAAIPLRSDSFLLNYLLWARPQTDAPLAYHLSAGLALLAITAPRDLCVHGLAGPLTYANIFALIVGRSGEDRKSTCSKLAVDRLLASVAPDLVAPEPGSEPGFVDQLAIQNTQIIHYDEFGSFLKRAQDGHMEDLKTRYNQAADCSIIGRKKANGKGVVIDQPRVSILAACADTYLSDYTNAGDWSGGFMRRWFVMHAHRERLMAIGPPPDEALTAWLKNEIHWRSVNTAGPCLGCDEAGEAIWLPWFAEVSSRALPEHIVGVRAAAPTMAAKVALLLGWDYGPARHGKPWRLSPAEIEPAIAITELHLKSLVSLSAFLAENKDMKDRRRVLNACAVPRTFGQIISEARLLKRRVNELLESLLEEGAVLKWTGAGPDPLYYQRQTP